MSKRWVSVLSALIFGLLFHSSSHALLIAGQDIIAAPTSVADDAPGAENTAQQAFNEAQDVLLTSDLAVDGGTISAGTVVDSHMIFLNSRSTTRIEDFGVDWIFDGLILGVMSDSGGTLEALSNSILGAAGTFYPGAFSARGLESNDGYTVSGNLITVDMIVTEPGDWIRVVTAASVPEPSILLLMAAGLLGIGFARRRSA